RRADGDGEEDKIAVSQPTAARGDHAAGREADQICDADSGNARDRAAAADRPAIGAGEQRDKQTRERAAEYRPDDEERIARVDLDAGPDAERHRDAEHCDRAAGHALDRLAAPSSHDAGMLAQPGIEEDAQ